MHNVFQPYQLAQHIPNHDGHHLQRSSSKRTSHHLYGRHPYCHPRQSHSVTFHHVTEPSAVYQQPEEEVVPPNLEEEQMEIEEQEHKWGMMWTEPRDPELLILDSSPDEDKYMQFLDLTCTCVT